MFTNWQEMENSHFWNNQLRLNSSDTSKVWWWSWIIKKWRYSNCVMNPIYNLFSKHNWINLLYNKNISVFWQNVGWYVVGIVIVSVGTQEQMMSCLSLTSFYRGSRKWWGHPWANPWARGHPMGLKGENSSYNSIEMQYAL